MNVPSTRLLTLSRQFKSEYLECLNDHQVVNIRDLGLIYGPVHELDRKAYDAPKMEVELMCLRKCECGDELRSCGQMNDIRCHGEWIQKTIPQYEHLRCLTVKLLLSVEEPETEKCYATDHGSALKTHIDQVLDASKLKKIDVHFFYEEDHDKVTDQERPYERCGNAQANWTVEGGWERR